MCSPRMDGTSAQPATVRPLPAPQPRLSFPGSAVCKLSRANFGETLDGDADGAEYQRPRGGRKVMIRH